MNKYLTLIRILTLIGVSSSVAGALEKCQPIRLPNGRARIQRQGRLVRFRCLKGYEFVGRRYMNCFHGQWDFERDPSVNPPMCVKPGCRASSYVNGHFLETYKGAVVSVVCDLGYTLIGSSTVYCNGYEWNHPFPECKAVNPTPPKSCDFEDGLCGWTQEPHGDWIWHKAEEPAEESIHHGPWCNGTGDHARPPYICGNAGGYMVLGNSSSRIANATERLFSPVFPPEYSNNACFTFWYKVNGLTAGYLKVFVKAEGVELYSTIPPFWVNGHQGFSWTPGYFPLDSSPSPFQVVIEGMSLPGNESETAFDHVEILSGEECATFRDTYFESPSVTSVTAETWDGDDGVNCITRCGTTASNSTDMCECRDSCLNEAICCVEYETFCISDVMTLPSTTEDSTTPISTTTEKSKTSVRMTRNFPETTVPNYATGKSRKISRTTEKGIYRSRSDAIINRRRFTAAIDNNIPGGSKKTSAKKSTTSAVSARSSARESPRPTATANITSKTSAAPKSRIGHKNSPIQIDLSLSGHLSKILLDGKIPESGHHVTGKYSPLPVKSDGDESAATSTGIPPGTVEAVVAVATAVVCGIVIAALIRRRRRKKTEKESMVEDSDSICFGMNPIYEKFSSQSSLICVRARGIVDGGGGHCDSDR